MKKSELTGLIQEAMANIRVNSGAPSPGRAVYNVIESSVEKCLDTIGSYKQMNDFDGDSNPFHDVEVALEEVLDLLIYTQDALSEGSVKK